MSEVSYLRGGVLVGLAIGAAAVVAALITGLVIAWLLGLLGLTEAGAWPLGPWLAGLGMLGGWQQVAVDGAVDSAWAAGAPLLVTVEAAAMVAGLARLTRLSLAGLLLAVVAAGGGAWVLAAVSTQTVPSGPGQGTVTQGLTLWWTDGLRPGTVTGAMLLVGAVGLAHTFGRRWWDAGRPVAMAVLLVPGVALSVVAAVWSAVRADSFAVAVGMLLLVPFLGMVLLLGLGGSPAEMSLGGVSGDPYVLAIWTGGHGSIAAGLFIAAAVAVLAGLWLRRRGHAGALWPGVTVPAVLALTMTWAMATTGDLPALAGFAALAPNPVTAGLVGAVLALISLLVRGRPAADESEAATAGEAASAE